MYEMFGVDTNKDANKHDGREKRCNEPYTRAIEAPPPHFHELYNKHLPNTLIYGKKELAEHRKE